MRAVNEGHVFQLVTKPCDLDLLVQTMHAAVRQHQLMTAERELLEQTLQGTVKLLTDMLTMVDPTGFVRATLLRDYVHAYLNLPGSSSLPRWEIEMAAMLLNLGQVAIPPSLMEKVISGAGLSDAEKEMVERIPETGFGLLANIPRFGNVAEVVRYQNKNYDGSGYPKDDLKEEDIPFGARLVHVLKHLLEKEAGGISRPAACASLKGQKGIYDPRIVDHCVHLKVRASLELEPERIVSIMIAELANKDVLVSPILTKEGVVIAPSGTEVSNLILEKVHNFSTLHVLREPIKVKRRSH